jgi:hypothetical protein
MRREDFKYSKIERRDKKHILGPKFGYRVFVKK